MNRQDEDLEEKFIAINGQITELFARMRGYGPLARLSEAEQDRLRKDVEDFVNSFEEAIAKGRSVGEWRVSQLKIPSVELANLLSRRHDLVEFILGG